MRGAKVAVRLRGGDILEVQHQQLQLGHIFDSVPDAFTPQSGVFDSSIRHMIRAKRRDLIGKYGADFQFPERLKNLVHVLCEDPGLQTIFGIIQRGKRFLKADVGRHREQRDRTVPGRTLSSMA